MAFDLAVVMPVYNEGECIREVVRSWLDQLDTCGLDYRLLVYNDGSKDHTAEELATFGEHPRVEVTDKPNSGHGPTVLQGYRRGCELAEWVFQVDSDDEIKADQFPPLWSAREGLHAVFAIRSGRQQTGKRRFISAVSRLLVKVLYGSGVEDVNVPFRLMRADVLASCLDQIPLATHAPNVIISGAFVRGGARVKNLPLPHTGRQTGVESIVKWKMWKAACRSALQTIRLRRVRVTVPAGADDGR